MATTTTLSDLPDVILYTIVSLVSDTRARNSLSLVSRNFLALERSTRYFLTLRGNARDLSLVPACFRSVSHLDLSFLYPWGHSDYLPLDHHLARRLNICFPSIDSLTLYSRSPTSLDLLLPQWPRIRHIKLVRWHEHPSGADDFVPIFQHCAFLESLDLSAFYHWPEDLPPALLLYVDVAARLTRLDLILKVAFTQGYKSSEILNITKSCPNLRDFRVACSFVPRYFGFVGDETLSAVATNCPKLRLLNMVDTGSLAKPRAIPGMDSGDSAITAGTLVEVFSALPHLEELVLDVGNNVMHSGVALKALNSKCKKLRALKLGQFQGVCSATDCWLDGVALCGGLKSLSIKNSGDLNDINLVAIGRGCCKLTTFEIQGCENVTVKGLRKMVTLLRKTLTDVRISCCKHLDSAASVRAIEPICDRIKKLHIDCVWSSSEVETSVTNHEDNEEYERSLKRCKYSSEKKHCSASDGNGFRSEDRVWEKLEYLSLWISVGELLTPLPMSGLKDCPNLEEIRIKIEGYCRGKRRPAELRLSCLALYPKLSKMTLDCGDTNGYRDTNLNVLTASQMQVDLSLWERFFLTGIGNLSLSELDYWPPQDRFCNQRSLSLLGAGLLQECRTLRKLFIHGTAHEHFMNLLLRIPYLRDLQLRTEYYPAPGTI